MHMPGFAFQTTNWESVEPVAHAGEKGTAYWRTQMFGDIRVRIVEYSAGYLADHWCEKGHVLLCLEGELHTSFQDGGMETLKAGMSYQLGDGVRAHKSYSPNGAK